MLTSLTGASSVHVPDDETVFAVLTLSAPGTMPPPPCVRICWPFSLSYAKAGMLRFWIHAFSCKSKQQGVQLATHMISCCSRVRNIYRARRAQGQDRMKMSKEGNAELPAGAAPRFNDTMVGDTSVMVRQWLGGWRRRCS